jgi:hypothetical protein
MTSYSGWLQCLIQCLWVVLEVWTKSQLVIISAYPALHYCELAKQWLFKYLLNATLDCFVSELVFSAFFSLELLDYIGYRTNTSSERWEGTSYMSGINTKRYLGAHLLVCRLKVKWFLVCRLKVKWFLVCRLKGILIYVRQKKARASYILKRREYMFISYILFDSDA